MTAIIICPDGFDIKLCGKRLTELAVGKIKAEGISDIKFAHNNAEEIRSEFKKSRSFPAVLFPANVLTEENLSAFENERADLTALSGGIFFVNILPENFSDIDSLVSSAYYEKLSVKEYGTEKYFLKISSREDYLKAQSDILSGKFVPPADISSCDAKYPEYAGKNIYFGKNTVISENVKISEGSYIGDNVYIGTDCEIISSAVMDNAYISSGAAVRSSIVHENASVGCGQVIADMVYKNETEKNPCKLVKKIFGTDGRLSGVRPEKCYSMGKSVGEKIVCAAYEASAEELFRAFSEGVAVSGGKIINLGEISENVFRFALRKENSDFGVFFSADYIRPWSADGLSSEESLRKTLENGINRSDGDYFADGVTRYPAKQNIGEDYLLFLSSISEKPIKEKFFADISCTQPFLYDILKEFAETNKLLNREKPRIAFHISADGARVSAYTDETGYVFHEKLVMLIISHSRKKFSLPSDFPMAADKIASSYRFDSAPDYEKMSDEEIIRDKRARKNADFRIFDAPSIMATVLSILSEKNISLSDAVKELPVYSFSGRMIPLKTKSSDIFKRLGIPDTGGRLYAERGKAYARPMRTGGIILFAESASMEISAEICSFYEDKFRRMDE